MTSGVVLLNFGEPADPTRADVVAYLERIFLANMSIEGTRSDADPNDRARTLAKRRAPSLLEDYESIGGSPLLQQATAQADAVETELVERGYDVNTYVGMQYTAPFIDATVADAVADGVSQLVGLPVFPLCGPSTTVAALAEFAAAVQNTNPSLTTGEITGWHNHPTYTRLRVENIASHVHAHGIDLSADDVALVFSAHGTPVHYLEEGSRYVEYVEEYCQTQAALLGIDSYEVGYQNHENRGVDWTEPSIDTVIRQTDAAQAVVEPVSFMHEQSETLAELDIDLKAVANEVGTELSRVPIPHDDPRFPELLADLVEPLIAGIDPAEYNLYPCHCREADGTVCLNAGPNRRPERLDATMQE